MPDDRAGAAAGVSPGGPTGAPLWDDWDTPPRVPTIPVLHLDGFDGPMDLLLDLAERQRIDLGRISVVALVEQFVAAMDRLTTQVPVERRADWIVVATRLVLLRSQLMFPASPEAVAEAEQEAARAIARLDALRVVRAAAAWLQARPQLGHDVFARPRSGPDPRVASYMALMEACLTVLRGREGLPDATASVYHPSIPELFRVPGALLRMRAKLAEDWRSGTVRGFPAAAAANLHQPGAARPLGGGQHLHGRARTRACGGTRARPGCAVLGDRRDTSRRPSVGPGGGAGTRIAAPPHARRSRQANRRGPASSTRNRQRRSGRSPCGRRRRHRFTPDSETLLGSEASRSAQPPLFVAPLP